MDFFSIVGTAIRRWYVLVPVLLISVLLGAQSYQSIGPSYTGSVSVAVLPGLNNLDGSDSDDDGDAQNPFSGGGGARFVAAILARNINSSAFLSRLDPPPAEGVTFEATPAEQQPIVRIDATAPSEAEVLIALNEVTEEAAARLAEVQLAGGAPESNLYRIVTAVPAGNLEDTTPNRFRTAVALMLIGIVLGAGAAVAFDTFVTRREDRATALARSEANASSVPLGAPVEPPHGIDLEGVPGRLPLRRHAASSASTDG
jgi:hypothetical protein